MPELAIQCLDTHVQVFVDYQTNNISAASLLQQTLCAHPDLTHPVSS